MLHNCWIHFTLILSLVSSISYVSSVKWRVFTKTPTYQLLNSPKHPCFSNLPLCRRNSLCGYIIDMIFIKWQENVTVSYIKLSSLPLLFILVNRNLCSFVKSWAYYLPSSKENVDLHPLEINRNWLMKNEIYF